jgi:periplasmic copper chaperone A
MLKYIVLPGVLGSMAAVSMALATVWTDIRSGPLTIDHPWIQVVPNLSGGAGYLTITNVGHEADRLMGANIAGSATAEVHGTAAEGVMAPIPGGVEIKPDQTLTLAPGSYHFMLPDLKGPFAPGALLKGRLQFQKAGMVPVEFEVRPVGVQESAHHMH